LTQDDSDCLPFLRKGLKNEDIDYGCLCGLIKVIGADAYKDIVALIVNKRRSLDSRSSSLSAICDHSGQTFNEDLPVFADMKPSDLPVAQIQDWANAGFPDRLPEKVETLVAALAKLGIELPEDYAKFLTKNIERRIVTISMTVVGS